MELATKIDNFLNALIAKTEHQNELLIGHCQSDVNLTSTQEHILMLLKNNKLTNTDLAKELSISQAAVSKAVKQLLKKELVTSVKDEKDARVTFLILTKLGKPMADEHEDHHQSTLTVYDTILENFSDDEKKTINCFLEKLSAEVL